MRRYLETIARSPLVFLVPLISIPLIAIVGALSGGQRYEVAALIWVEPSPLLTVPGAAATTSSSSGRSGAITSPNMLEAQALSERLETEAFRLEVMDRVGLFGAIQRGEWPVASQLQSSIDSIGLVHSIPGLRSVLRSLQLVPPMSASERLSAGLRMVLATLHVESKGGNLLRVGYTGPEPRLGQRLIEETILLFNERTVESRAQDAQASIDFYNRQLQIQRERMEEAGGAYQEYLSLHPEPLPGQSRPPAEAAQLGELQRAYIAEQALYESALRKVQDVRVLGEAAVTTRTQTFQVIDPPKAPENASVSRQGMIKAIILGLAIGALLGGIPVVLMTWLDRTVRTPEDLQEAVNADLVVLAPEVPRRRGDNKHFVRRVVARILQGTPG